MVNGFPAGSAVKKSVLVIIQLGMSHHKYLIVSGGITLAELGLPGDEFPRIH